MQPALPERHSVYKQDTATGVDAAALAASARHAEQPLEVLQQAVTELDCKFLAHFSAMYNSIRKQFEVLSAQLDAQDPPPMGQLAAQLQELQAGTKAMQERLSRAAQVQNALNQRVNLQCSLLLSNLDTPAPLTAAECEVQDALQRDGKLASLLAADAKQLAAPSDSSDAPRESKSKVHSGAAGSGVALSSSTVDEARLIKDAVKKELQASRRALAEAQSLQIQLSA